ncbi:MAG TPA: hypothetical protein PK224_09280 [Nitrospira sp.]|nr:hypothetical protein [Nitrospira sp.]
MINDQVFTKATQLLEPILNDFSNSLASSIAQILSQRRKHVQPTTTSQDAQRLQTLRATMARDQQETLRAMNETAWSDAALAKIPTLDLLHFAYEHSVTLRQEFGTIERFEAYWRNLCRQKTRRVARDEQGKR